MLKAIQIIAITLAGTVLVGTFALIFAESRWVDPNPKNPRDYFLHGSTGTELMPLAVFQVLPTLFPEQFQPAGARSAAQFMEELAILKRWYYRSHKVGEIVLADDRGSFSARKIANAVERVLQRAKPEKTTEDTKEHEGITPEAGS